MGVVSKTSFHFAREMRDPPPQEQQDRMLHGITINVSLRIETPLYQGNLLVGGPGKDSSLYEPSEPYLLLISQLYGKRGNP
jgi:hypothetical protein